MNCFSWLFPCLAIFLFSSFTTFFFCSSSKVSSFFIFFFVRNLRRIKHSLRWLLNLPVIHIGREENQQSQWITRKIFYNKREDNLRNKVSVMVWHWRKKEQNIKKKKKNKQFKHYWVCLRCLFLFYYPCHSYYFSLFYSILWLCAHSSTFNAQQRRKRKLFIGIDFYRKVSRSRTDV